ncbi:MAG: sodium:calcium antiporter [Deltaproteobacteria bacterium]|nr:sodium:calcium antiporter [Deltaproteobacteria bacterium]
MLMLWLQFILCSAVIVLCGTNLSRYGDVIAEKTGLGRAWIGLVLMASVTSLPELINGISSVAFVDAPNIALGDIMGSCVFNLSIIALMDILHGPKPIFSKAEHGHIISAGFGVILIGLASISILSNASIPSIGHVGAYTPAIILIYLIGIRGLFLFEKKKIAEFVGEMAEAIQYGHVSTKEAVIKYSLNALIIVGAAAWLPFIGDRLAEETGLGRSFIGSTFIALTTSLPELVVSISALRIGATDMAIANLFGSNMFNISILAIDDLFYTKGPLLSHVSMNHAVTGFMAVIMTGIAIVGLTYRLEKKTFLRLGWDAIAMLMAYIVNIYLLYSMRGKG